MNKSLDDLISSNIGLVYSIVNKYSSKILSIFEYDDAIQIGCIALVNAAKTFDDKQDTSFSTYAYKCIYNYIITQVRVQSCKRNNKSIVSLDEFLYDSDKTSLLNIISTDFDLENNSIIKNIKEILYKYINELPETQKNILILRCNYKTFKDIAKQLNLSDNYIQQQYQKALNNLRIKFRKDGII